MNYFLYSILNILALFFLFASIMGMPGNPDKNNKREQAILDFADKMVGVAFRIIPILAGGTLVTFVCRLNTIGKLLSYANFLLGLGMISIMVVYWGIKKSFLP